MSEDKKNEDDEEFDVSCGKSRDAFRDEEMHKSHATGQSDSGPSQTECNVCGRSTRVDDDFDTYAAVRIDLYAKMRR